MKIGKYTCKTYSSDFYVYIDLTTVAIHCVFFLRLISNPIFFHTLGPTSASLSKVPLAHMIIDECKYTCDSHLVNSAELKGKYTYVHTNRQLSSKALFFSSF